MDKKELFKYLIKEFQERDLPNFISRDLIIPKIKKIVTLVGTRRSGKTFYFYQLIKNILDSGIAKERIVYLNFEDDRILPLNFKELDSILEAYFELYPENKKKEVYLFFDELQNIKSWELYVRRIYDTEKVHLFITGSNSKLLAKEIATALRGRTLSFNLFPLSFKEFLNFNKLMLDKDFSYTSERFKVKNYLEKYVNLGGFPEIALEKNQLEQKILKNYFEVMIYRDIVERFSVRNIHLLKDISKFLLTNISVPFSINAYYNALKENMAVGKETVFEYVSYLEEAGVIFLVPFFSYSLKKQQANPKKVYTIDNGLRNAVCFRFSQDEGKLVENLVFLELKRREKEVYYWKGKGEVDFVVKDEMAINVSYTNDIAEREVNSLLELKNEFKGRLIIITRDLEKSEKGIEFIPLWKWLLEE